MEKLTNASIGIIRLFETMTRTMVKGLFTFQSTYYFVVKEGEAGKAIGKHGVISKRLVTMLRHPLKIVEYHQDPAVFTQNLIAPVKVERVEVQDGSIIITEPKTSVRAHLIGRDRVQIEFYSSVLKKYFQRDLKVVAPLHHYEHPA